MSTDEKKHLPAGRQGFTQITAKTSVIILQKIGVINFTKGKI
jgi:hypothetical protein